MLNSDRQRQLGKLKLLEKILLHSSASGDYQSFVRGCGFDFLQLREYHDGDDIRFLNWNAYAKTGKLLIKETAPERDRAIIIVLDCSASNRFSSQKTLKSELALDLTYALSYLALRSKDSLGLLTFGGEKLDWLPCSKSRHQFFSVFNLATEKMGQEKGSCLTMALEFLINLRSRKSLVFFISDFIAPDFFEAEKHWAALMRKHYIVPVFISDPLEGSFALPSLLLQCQDPETDELLTVETSVVLDQYLQQRTKDQLDFFRLRQRNPLTINTSEDLVQRLLFFFSKR
jgi:uncharacterized protein (DUF58 family)